MPPLKTPILIIDLTNDKDTLLLPVSPMDSPDPPQLPSPPCMVTQSQVGVQKPNPMCLNSCI